MSFHQFYHQNQRCPLHRGERIAKSKKHDINFIRKMLQKEGYTLLSDEYINGMTKIEIRCPENHVYNVRWNNFQQGKRCPECKPKYSKDEKAIVNYLKTTYNYNIVENDRTIIVNPLTNKMLELDIYIPELNKAIEYNGIHWHSSKYVKFKDNQKIIQCKSKNISLLIIKDSNWKINKDFSIIDHFIND
jgi:hypothetical protein